MDDRSQDSAHPLQSLVPDERVLRDELVTRWAGFYDLLLADSAATVTAVQLDGDATAPVMSGTAAELMAAGEAAGAGTSPWAVIAPIRPEIQVVDVDRCADRVLQPLLDAADTVGASLAHLTESGTPNSVHLGVTLPSRAARREFTRRVSEIRAWAGETQTTVDLRSRLDGLRLPGSAPLKPGGGVCWPTDTDGRRMTAIAAYRRLADALNQPHVDAGEPLPSPAPMVWDDVDETDAGELAVVAPRAYRAPTRMTREQFKTLTVSPRRGRRSHAALAGAWVLWRLGVRSWRAAARYYAIYPCFEKWRERDAHARARGRNLEPGWVSWCQRHWQDIARRARAYRPETASLHEPRISEALAEVNQWDDPDLVAAAVAVIRHRFSDGYGLTRPVGVRDLASWLGFSEETARRRLQGLAERGLLAVVKPHNRETAPHEATVWTLSTPAAVYRSSVSHDVTSPQGMALTLHPCWVALGQTARLVYTQLSPTPVPAAALSAQTGLPTGTRHHGLLRLLHTLCDQGLATRSGQGRATRWLIGPAGLDDAPAAGAGRAARERVQSRVILDRDVWHARGRDVVSRALHRRAGARAMQRRRPRRASTAQGGSQLALVHPVNGPAAHGRSPQRRTARLARSRGLPTREPPTLAGG
ncbi:hypothetical protein LX12_004295 [Williamsia serinedens]|uniref:Uncharacterized protein n=1 Tax=Williamsia serinedens TaxID=391736 RepID=A0ABT1H766_9NOCA|nr:hypothetical protein [Williamsia serinedens]